MKKTLFILGIVLMLALTACGTQKSGNTSTSNKTTQTKTASESAFKISKAETAKVIAISKDTFGPVVDVVHTGDTVTWSNTDASIHQIVSYPNAPQSFKVGIKGNQKVTHKFTKPGIYRYYGKNAATYSKKMGDVSANKQAKSYPIPMRGVVVVLNANNKLPASAKASVNIPDSTMAFTPWNLTVNPGTTVSWSNHDDMTHMVASVPGYTVKQMKTLTLKKASGKGKMTFNQPGVYYYYCPMHAQWDSKTGQMIPQKSYGSFPYVMDGLIIVNAKK